VAKYLVQLGYTPQAWASQIKDPKNRVEIVSKLLESMGARFEATYMAFGEYDIVFIMDAPDNVTAAAISMVVSAGGAVKSLQTTALITIEEGIEAMRRAGKAASAYQPPKG
jgi:uncharacterized protein with GYD domain